MDTLIAVVHETLIDETIATEYSESTVRTYAQALNIGHTELDEVGTQNLNRLSIPDAFGVGLDNIGKVVGQPRTVIGASNVVFFGFQGIVESNGFGDANDVSAGGRFREDGESITGNKRLIDSEYRAFINSRISKNNTKSRPEDTIAAFTELFGVSPIMLQDAYPATGHATITFTEFLSANAKALLLEGSLIPKTVGVQFHYQEVVKPFGFAGYPLSNPFGDANDSPVTGGSFPRDLS